MSGLLLGLGETLGGFLDVLLSKHELVPATQSFSLVSVRGKRLCRQSGGFISDIRLEMMMDHPPDGVMRAA